MEDEIDSIALLEQSSACVLHQQREWKIAYFCGKSHAAGDKKTTLSNTSCHHAKLGLLDKGYEIANLLLQAWLLFVLGRVRVGGLAARVGVGVRHFGDCSCNKSSM